MKPVDNSSDGRNCPSPRWHHRIKRDLGGSPIAKYLLKLALAN